MTIHFLSCNTRKTRLFKKAAVETSWIVDTILRTLTNGECAACAPLASCGPAQFRVLVIVPKYQCILWRMQVFQCGALQALPLYLLWEVTPSQASWVILLCSLSWSSAVGPIREGSWPVTRHSLRVGRAIVMVMCFFGRSYPGRLTHMARICIRFWNNQGRGPCFRAEADLAAPSRDVELAALPLPAVVLADMLGDITDHRDLVLPEQYALTQLCAA